MFNSNDFNFSFQNFFDNRCTKISDTIVLNNAAYKEVSSKHLEVYHKLQKTLTEEQKTLLDEYEELETLGISIHTDLIYREAFKDGFQLNKFLNSSNEDDNHGGLQNAN